MIVKRAAVIFNVICVFWYTPAKFESLVLVGFPQHVPEQSCFR